MREREREKERKKTRFHLHRTVNRLNQSHIENCIDQSLENNTIVNRDFQNIIADFLEFLRCKLVELISTFSQNNLILIVCLDLISGPCIFSFLGFVSVQRWRVVTMLVSSVVLFSIVVLLFGRLGLLDPSCPRFLLLR